MIRQWIRAAVLLLTVVLAVCSSSVSGEEPGRSGAKRPNFVWILSEDNSKHYLRLYDGWGAATPNIESLAAHGLLFRHAFSNGPVCSTARTTLITGIYGPRIFTQFHRKMEPARLPDGWLMFPALLRQAGYYTTNNAKKDYNAVESPGVWDESSRRASWRNRPRPDQPFFHMESHSVSHESSLHFTRQQMEQEKTTADPQTVRLAPYHPDTPLFRYTYARYLDRMADVDRIVGQTVARLRQDGLLEDTFIFYFGDHGGVLPRSKGYLYESGLHVPLVVRVPQKWKHLVDAPLGHQVDGFVEFVDLGATVLNLAGVPVPEYMDGKPVLGPGTTLPQVNQRQEALGYADRFDEKYDMVRTLRQGRFKYFRNYQCYYPDGLQNNYRYRMLAYQQWRELYQAGKLNEVQRAFFEPRAPEALYDVEADPHETRNLAGDPAYAEVLQRLRQRLRQRLKEMPDLSFFPESVLVEEAARDPVAFGRDQKERIGRLVDTADLVLLPSHQAVVALKDALRDEDPWVRYWGAIACACLGKDAAPLAEDAEKLLRDPQPLVRVRAAEFLARIGTINPGPVLLEVLRTTDSYPEAAITLNSVVYLRDVLGFDLTVTRQDVRARGMLIDRRLEYLEYPPAR